MKFKDMKYPVLIGATHVPELNAIEVRRGAWPGAGRERVRQGAQAGRNMPAARDEGGDRRTAHAVHATE